MVQDVFYRIWKKRKELRVDSSARNFLMACVRNACVDFLRKQEVEARGMEYYIQRVPVEEELYTTSELEQLLEAALAKLPEQIASVFRLNRGDCGRKANIRQDSGSLYDQSLEVSADGVEGLFILVGDRNMDKCIGADVMESSYLCIHKE